MYKVELVKTRIDNVAGSLCEFRGKSHASSLDMCSLDPCWERQEVAWLALRRQASDWHFLGLLLPWLSSAVTPLATWTHVEIRCDSFLRRKKGQNPDQLWACPVSLCWRVASAFTVESPPSWSILDTHRLTEQDLPCPAVVLIAESNRYNCYYY